MNSLFGPSDLFIETSQFRFLFVGRNDNQRVCVLRVPLQRPAFGDVIEERKELVELALRDRIVFVVVATTAVECQCHPGHPGCFHAVDHGFDAPFLGDDSPFAVQAMIAIETRCDVLGSTRVGNEIASQLVNRELIKRLITIERFNHPVSPGPLISTAIGLIPVTVSVASEIEPLQRHSLAVSLRLQQAINDFFVCVGRLIGQKRLDFRRGRREPCQIERHSPNQRLSRCFRRRFQPFLDQTRQNELVDGVTNPVFMIYGRWDRPLNGQKCPVPLIFGPLGNPLFQEFNLPGRQFFAGTRWRHLQIFVAGDDASHQFTGLGLCRNDRRPSRLTRFHRGVFQIQSQACLTLVLIRAMTLKAVIRKNRPDISIERDLIVGRTSGGGSDRDDNNRHRNELCDTDHQADNHASHFQGVNLQLVRSSRHQSSQSEYSVWTV